MDDSRWASDLWEQAEEPSLYALSRQMRAPDRTTIRFTASYLPLGDVSVRFEESKSGVALIAKELFTLPERKLRKIDRPLSHDEINQLANFLKSGDIFDQPSMDCQYYYDIQGEYIAEMASNGKYNIVLRCAPNQAMYDFGIFALKLTGWYPEGVPERQSFM